MSAKTIAKLVVIFCCSFHMVLMFVLQWNKFEKEGDSESWKHEHKSKRTYRQSGSLHLAAYYMNNEVSPGNKELNPNLQRRILRAGLHAHANNNDQNIRPIRGVDNRLTRLLSSSSTSGISGNDNNTDKHFHFLVNEPNLCEREDAKSPYLLVQVHSHFGHKAQRDAIRDTWGRISRDFEKDQQVRLIFIVGRDGSLHGFSDKLMHESKLYRDIIVGTSLDTYRNLTLKSLAGLYWATRYCSNASFLLKADDDMFLNVPSILSLLKHVQLGGNILGALNKNASVVRKGLWAVDVKLFPQAFYPPYCSGNSYIMKIRTAGSLLSAVPRVRMLPIEDVYVTGILARETGKTCQGHPSFPHWYVGPSPKQVCALLANRLYGIHNVQYEQMYKIFQKVQIRRTCGSLKHKIHGLG